MAKEKFILGKKDDKVHEGKASERRRLMESDDVLTTLWPELGQAVKDGALEDEKDFHPVPDELATE